MSIPLMSLALYTSLPPTEKLVLIALCDRAHPDGSSAYPSVSTLCCDSSFTRRAVQRALRSLEKQGLIAPEDEKDSGVIVYAINVPVLTELAEISLQARKEAANAGAKDTHHSAIKETPKQKGSATGTPPPRHTDAPPAPQVRPHTLYEPPIEPPYNLSSPPTQAPTPTPPHTPAGDKRPRPPEPTPTPVRVSENPRQPSARTAVSEPDFAGEFSEGPVAPAGAQGGKPAGAGAPVGSPSLDGAGKRAVQKALCAHFSQVTAIPLPKTGTEREKKAAGVRWWGPMREMAELVGWSISDGEALIDLTVARLAGMTVSAPQSLLNTARAIQAEMARGKVLDVQTGRDVSEEEPAGFAALREYAKENGITASSLSKPATGGLSPELQAWNQQLMERRYGKSARAV